MSRLPILISIVAIGALPAGAAFARTEDTQVTLSTRGVDFTDPVQVKAFYNRVNAAARAVCNGDTLTPWGVKEGEACRNQFVSDAVRQVNAPLLTAMNNQGSRKTSAYAADDR